VKLLWCNAAKAFTLCFKIRDQVMNRLPTLLVLAHACVTRPSLTSGEPSPQDLALHLFSNLHDTLRKGLESGLPMLLVATAEIAEQARAVLPGKCVVELPDKLAVGAHAAPDNFARAVAAGVLASAQANGWLLLPAHNIPMLRADTLKQVAHASSNQPIIFPQYRQLRGHPIRFSSEFFSELIRLQSERDVDRLIARYPAVGVEIDDPGVLMIAREVTENIPSMATTSYTRQSHLK
jgi:molybdenum cofactor cytidylyltransferase